VLLALRASYMNNSHVEVAIMHWDSETRTRRCDRSVKFPFGEKSREEKRVNWILRMCRVDGLKA
jgi:hypothetical protein